MLLSIQVPVFALTQGPAQIVIQTPSGEQGNTQILPKIDGYTLNYVYRDTAFENVSGEDASLVYIYGSPSVERQTVWATIELAATQSLLHGWETCLYTFPLSKNQPTVTELDLRDVQIQENPPTIARYFAFQNPYTNQIEVILYWYTTGQFNINGTVQKQQIKMSLIAYPMSPDNVSETENQLLPIAVAINEYWQPIANWSRFALIMSQNGLALSTTTTALLVILILFRLFLQRREKIQLQRTYEKLSLQDKLVVKAVHSAAKHGRATTEDVFDEFQGMSQKPPSETWLTDKLLGTETAGLIEKRLTNTNDVPTIKWKSNIPGKTLMSNTN